MQASPVSFRHYAAIFLVALVTIATQILISRIFSVTFYYHYAFGGITFAMLGLTAGALKVYQDPVRFGAERASAVLAERLAFRAVSGVGHAPPCVVARRRRAVAERSRRNAGDLVPVSGHARALMAFIESGICIAILLTRFPGRQGGSMPAT